MHVNSARYPDQKVPRYGDERRVPVASSTDRRVALRKMRFPMLRRSVNSGTRKTAWSKLIGLDLLVRAGCGCLLTGGQAFAEPLASPSFGGPLKPNPNPIGLMQGRWATFTSPANSRGIPNRAKRCNSLLRTDKHRSLTRSQQRADRNPNRREAAAILCPGRRLRAPLAGHGLHTSHGCDRSVVRSDPHLLWEAGRHAKPLGAGRLLADACRRGLELYVPEHDHHRRAVVEPAARDQPRRAGLTATVRSMPHCRSTTGSIRARTAGYRA